jgi:predicted alpha/beta hydrolase
MTGKSSNAGRRVSSSAGWRLGLVFVCLAAGIVPAGYFWQTIALAAGFLGHRIVDFDCRGNRQTEGRQLNLCRVE